jgi:hypothetical protein
VNPLAIAYWSVTLFLVAIAIVVTAATSDAAVEDLARGHGVQIPPRYIFTVLVGALALLALGWPVVVPFLLWELFRDFAGKTLPELEAARRELDARKSARLEGEAAGLAFALAEERYDGQDVWPPSWSIPWCTACGEVAAEGETLCADCSAYGDPPNPFGEGDERKPCAACGRVLVFYSLRGEPARAPVGVTLCAECQRSARAKLDS